MITIERLLELRSTINIAKEVADDAAAPDTIANAAYTTYTKAKYECSLCSS